MDKQQAIFCPPDLSARPHRLTSERMMQSIPDVLYRAWTEQVDRWFAAPGTLLMKPRSMRFSSGKPVIREIAIHTTAAFSSLSRIGSLN